MIPVVLVAGLAAVLLLLVPDAAATDSIPASNCSTGADCQIGADHPVDMKVCVNPANGKLSWSTFDGQALDQGSVPSCSTASFWVVNSGGDLYADGAVAQYQKVWKDPGGKYMEQHFVFTGKGENIHMKVNYTLVTNGTLIHYHVHNHGSTPWDFGWKYSYDIQVGPENDPDIFVPNRPGDGLGPVGTYDQQEAHFGLSHDIPFVKAWQTRTGPDGPNDLKQYFWFDPLYGGTPADLIQFGESGSMLSRVSTWVYQTGTVNIGGDAELQTYFGYPDLYTLMPDDGQPGGPDEVEKILWFTTGVPEPLIKYGMDVQFLNRDPLQSTSVAFVEAGGTAVFPIKVTSRTGIGSDGGGARATTFDFEADIVDLPGGWDWELVDADTQQEVETVTLQTGEAKRLFLKVTADKQAFGNDAARINFRALITDLPDGVFNKAASEFRKTVATTTIVRPDYAMALDGGGEVVDVMPGETATFDLTVRNLGNLREPFGVEMDVASGVGIDWNTDLSPAKFSLERGEKKAVTLTLQVPDDAFGGERTIVARASIPEQNQANTTLLKLNVLSDSSVQIYPDLSEIVLAPGETATFGASVVNVGFEDVLVDLHANADPILGISQPQGASSAAQWKLDVIADGFDEPLSPQEVRRVTIRVTAPDDAAAGEQKNLVLLATKEGSTNELDRRLVQAVVGRQSTLLAEPDLDAITSDPGRTLTYRVQILNHGNSLENLTVEMGNLPAGWEFSASPERFELDVQGQRQILLDVYVPPHARAGTHDLTLLVRNADQVRSSEVDLVARINQVYRATVTTETPSVLLLPTDDFDIDFVVRNMGNGADSFMLSGFPSDWEVDMDPAQTSLLQPGQQQIIRVRGDTIGDVGVTQVAISPVSIALGEATSDPPQPLTITVARPDLAIRSAKVVSPADHPGDLEVIQAVVENLGQIEAKNVAVTLYVNGKETGTRVNFDRLAPERSLVASLPWAKTEGDHVYRVVIDPDNLHDEGDAEDNNEAVFRADAAFHRQPALLLGSDSALAEKASPGVGPLVVVAVMAAALLGVRWQRKDSNDE